MKIEQFTPVVYKTFNGEYGEGYIYSFEREEENIMSNKGVLHTQVLTRIKVSKKPKWEYKEEDLIEVEQVRFLNNFIQI